MTQAPASPNPRKALVRPRSNRLLAGVCVGLAEHLGLPVNFVRLTLAVATVALPGSGVVLYAWLWVLVPQDARRSPSLLAGAPDATGEASETTNQSGADSSRWASGTLMLLGGLALVGVAVALSFPGLITRPELLAVAPIALIVIGGAVALTQFDRVEGASLAESLNDPDVRLRLVQMSIAVCLIPVGAVLLAVLRGQGGFGAGTVVVAVGATVLAVALAALPWGRRLWREMDAERLGRAREAERAEVAAHLHDSVLQTLALIQRSSDNPEEVARLSRAQERELRTWLYGQREAYLAAEPTQAAGPSLAAALGQVAEAMEAAHPGRVDLVCVGDRELDPAGSAVVAAVREAMLNAMAHSGSTVQIYLECRGDLIEAFVRDRGRGFDLAAVGTDRLGVRESIIGRIERQGGKASVHSVIGEGTEVKIRLRAPQAGSATGQGSSAVANGNGNGQNHD